MYQPLTITRNFVYQPLENIFWWLVIVFIFFSVAVANIFAPWYCTFLIVTGFPLVIILATQPRLGTYLLAFLVPVTTTAAYVVLYGKWNFIIGKKPIDLLPLFLPVLLFAFAGFTVMRLARLPQSMRNPITIPLFLFLAYAALTISWTDITEHGVFQCLILAANIMVFVLVVGTVHNEASHKTLMWCWVLSITLQSLIAVIMYFLNTIMLKYQIASGATLILNIQGGLFQPSGWPRPPSGLQDFHETALFINLAIPIALGLWLTESRRIKKVFLLIVIIFMILVCIRTESRAGIGSLILMVLGTFYLIKRLRRFLALVIIFFPVSVILIALGFNAVFNYYENTNFEMRLIVLGGKAVESGDVVDPGMGSSNVHGRMNLWIKSFKKYIEVAVQGLGIGNLKYESQAPHAHSIYFSVLFDFGLIGIGLVLSGILIMVRKYSAAFKQQTSYLQIMSFAFLGGFFALGFHGLVDMDYNFPIFWFYPGMAVATFNLAHREFSEVRNRDLGADIELNKVQAVPVD
jgi:O-antigen ligase